MRGLTRNQLLLTLAAVVLLVVGIVFVVLYFQAGSHQAAVAEDIDKTEANIARMTVDYDIDRLAAELALLQTDLADAPIPTTVDNVAVFQDVHEAAVTAKVEYDYEYNDKPIKIGNTPYTAMTFDIDTSGTLVRIIRFLGLLEDMSESDYPTLRITGIELGLGASEIWDVSFTIQIIVQGG